MLIYLSLIDTEEDRLKFEQIYILYRQDMMKAAFHVLQNQHNAEDAVHETLVRVASHVSELPSAGSVKTKAYVIIAAKNTAIGMARKRKKELAFPYYDYINDENVSIPPAEEMAFDKFGVEVLEEALRSLPDNYYEALFYTQLMGKSVRETAKLLGISEANMQKRIERARAKLAKIITEQEGNND